MIRTNASWLGGIIQFLPVARNTIANYLGTRFPRVWSILHSETSVRCRGYCQLLDVKLYRVIVFVQQNRTREIQGLLICSPSVASDDFDYHYFYPNTSKFQERSKLLIRNLNIGILRENRYHRIQWFQFIAHLFEAHQHIRSMGKR
jgi:hypothetical protein